MVDGGKREATIDSGKIASPIDPPMRYCRHCQAEVGTRDTTCPNCHHDPAHVYSGSGNSGSFYPNGVYKPPRNWRADYLWGGTCAIIAGVLALGQGIGELSFGLDIFSPWDHFSLFGMADVIFGLGSMIGGIVAIRRFNFAIAMYGAAMGTLGFGFVIGSAFGVIAVGLIAMSRGDFK